MKHKSLYFLVVIIPLGGCEPLRGVLSEKDIAGSADISCVQGALNRTFGKVERWDYVSDGGTFPAGTQVAQFAYFLADDGRGWVTLEIGQLDGNTKLAHSFTNVGSRIPDQNFQPAFRAMVHAAYVLRGSCKLDLRDMPLKAVGQKVDALNR